MNKVILVGNLARDPDSKVTQTGKARALFTVAVNRPYTDQNGQRGADFISCIAYDRTAETVSKYLSKGRKVGVEGRLRTGSYEKDGKTVYTTEIIADRVEFLSSAQDAQREPQEQTEQQPTSDGSGYVQVDDEELPF